MKSALKCGLLLQALTKFAGSGCNVTLRITLDSPES